MKPQTLRCAYCGCHTYTTVEAAKLAGNADMVRTRDHYEPKCKGGRVTVPCCHRGNFAKEDGCPEEFKLFAQLVLKGAAPRVPKREALVAFRAWRIRSMF